MLNDDLIIKFYTYIHTNNQCMSYQGEVAIHINFYRHLTTLFVEVHSTDVESDSFVIMGISSKYS